MIMRRRVAAATLTLLLCSPMTIASAKQETLNIETTLEEPVENKIIILTVKEAIKQAIENNPEIEGKKLEIEQEEINFTENIRNIRRLRRDLGNPDEDSFTYLEYIQIPEAGLNLKLNIANRNLDDEVQKIKSSIETTYYNLLQADKLKEINKKNIEVSNELYNIAKKRFDLGLTTNQEVLNAKLNKIKAQNEYDNSVKNLKNANMGFNMQLGYGILQNTKLTDSLEYKQFELEDINQAIKKAVENNNGINTLKDSYELQELEMRNTRAGYADITYVYRRQEVEVEKAKKALQDAKKGIEMQVRSNYLEIIQKQKQIESGQKSVELAKENLRLAKLSYEAGVGVFTDLEQAQTMLMQAELGLSQAILDYNLEVLKLENTMGLDKVVIEEEK